MTPYETLDDRAFWAPAVAQRNMFDISDLWQAKYSITAQHRVVTFGSCFAQHIGRALVARRFGWLDTEPAPPGLSADLARQFNYGVFSCRTGNIYTVSLLRQWCNWALGITSAPDEIWQRDGRYFDPFRPNIEPDGFASPDEAVISRLATISAFRTAIEQADVFVFTLGLTESWINRSGGYEYPVCPGVIAGMFDDSDHVFVNQDYPAIHAALQQVIGLLHQINPDMRFLLSVSPVPLTATNSGSHVLVASTGSKAILRAVAGQLASQNAMVDYFPAYEVITAPPFRGVFFEPNQRHVNRLGIAHVMNMFFAALGVSDTAAPGPDEPLEGASESVCEEDLLAAFTPP